MAAIKLDELQWSDPMVADEMQGIHSNSVLFYFMRSPYFDKTSNNNTIYNQALHNHTMFPVLETRERFEEFLKSMSGVEYIVHQAPAEMAPGTGTGVWVIRKQLRRKRNDGRPDDITVYADYFVVGYNIYQAPNLADILSSRITSMAVALGKAFPAMDSMLTWSPAKGHVYETDDEEDDDDEDDGSDSEDEGGDAMDVDRPAKAATTAKNNDDDNDSESDDDDDGAAINPKLAEESFTIHQMFGHEYMDEMPISGRPGDFHFNLAGGGKRALGADPANPGAANNKNNAIAKDTGSGKGTPVSGAATKDGKDAKAGAKTGTAAPTKPKRRKSKGPAAA
ncbi:mediator of rna polymerase ii transcription subunit 6 [Ophiostoma piceae UAMH 11346]|uniref:Mediator of RNA polymerase II transcription subunit 6 n=1 Tax=Ophiostoma piceae (strain UAMH 11346) TaxID=1262450 RepID=S3BPI6_OPHP1|nr:mediator of rna polymerase ii transcription subunit 6 [Ophiostoma piceae UAMH 11346]